MPKTPTRAPMPPGSLRYGRLDHHRTLTCDYCHGSWVSPSGHGRICPNCRGGEQHRADKAAYHRAYRQRRAARHAGAGVAAMKGGTR